MRWETAPEAVRRIRQWLRAATGADQLCRQTSALLDDVRTGVSAVHRVAAERL